MRTQPPAMGGGGEGKGLGPCIIMPPRPGGKGGLGGRLRRPSFTGGLTPMFPTRKQKQYQS